jgi:putative inorganic carbon (HCO3(-)) transporter
MIDWWLIVANSLWIVGLAILLAVAGYASGTGSRLMQTGQVNSPADAREGESLWSELAKSGWALAGMLLFCAGMALTGRSWIEGALWVLLGLYVGSSRMRNNDDRRPMAGNSRAFRIPHSAFRIPTLPHPSWPGWLRRGAEWIAKTELLWLVLLSPFFIFPSTGRALPVLLGLPALWIARWIARGRFIPRTPFDLSLLVLLGMVPVSLYATPDPALSLPKITGLLFGVGLFYALVEWVTAAPSYESGAASDVEVPDRGRDGARVAMLGRMGWVVAGFMLASLLLVVVGLLGTDWGNKLPALSGITSLLPASLRGLPGAEEGINPNEVGGALMWCLPLEVALIWWSWRSGWLATARGRLLSAALALLGALSCFALVLTQSRSALAGFCVGLLLLLWLALPPRGKIVLGGLVAVFVVAGITISAYAGPQAIGDTLFGTSGGEFSPTAALNSFGNRVEIWSRGVYGVEDFPLTGMGMNAFREVMPLLYPIADANLESDLAHAHNQFLQTALDLGLPGLVAYVAIWLGSFALLVQVWRSSADALSRALVGGIAAGLLASLVFGVADAMPLGDKPGFLFWWLLGLLAALWRGQLLKVGDTRGQAVDIEQGARARSSGEGDAVALVR